MRTAFHRDIPLLTSRVRYLRPAFCRLVPVLLLLITHASGLTAGTYYLSPAGSDTAGSGTRQKPWKTVAVAAGKVPDAGVEVGSAARKAVLLVEYRWAVGGSPIATPCEE